MVVDGRRVGMHWPEILNPPHVSALQKQAYIHTHTSRSPLPSGGESGVERGGVWSSRRRVRSHGLQLGDRTWTGARRTAGVTRVQPGRVGE